ncbi:MAG: VCBS repeat-containing protein [Planctomycetes bacterium]|nr:VCBS repeat-containing protein [Planctomycetota bacterium]
MAVDFGDAPDPYPTTLADDGARHEAIGPTLGATRDADDDGQPSTGANGDGADDDGVKFGAIRVGQLDAGVTVNIQNAPAGAKLDAWIDFNGDGNWGGPGERIAASVSVLNGDNQVEFDVPSHTASGETFARFRLSTAGGLGLVGSAADGEVEDYRITIDPPAAAAIAFRARYITTDAGSPWSVAAADVDGDGDMDVLSAARGGFAWHENRGEGAFVEHAISGDASGSFITADLDGDGDVDVIGQSQSGGLAWYENDGQGMFVVRGIADAKGQGSAPIAVDLDGDGDIDIIVRDEINDNVSWYENDGQQGFTSHIIGPVTDANRGLPHSIAAVDIDGDGDLDVISSGYSLDWHENDGQQNFSKRLIGGHPFGFGGPFWSVAAADFDGDGDIDVIAGVDFRPIGHSDDFDHLVFFENDGNQTFTGDVIETKAAGPLSAHVADIDGDGDLDLINSSYYGFDEGLTWHENVGQGTFAKRSVSNSANRTTSVFVADVDGDGDLDVLSTSYRSGAIVWYENLAQLQTADLTGDGFVDFVDLTWLLAHWNQNVSALEGNLVDPDSTPVNFEDLTVLLAAWTGPGPAGAPVGRRLAAAVGGDWVGDVGGSGESVAVGDASYRRGDEAPRQAAAYAPLRRLQAAAVDRALADDSPRRDTRFARRSRRGR